MIAVDRRGWRRRSLLVAVVVLVASSTACLGPAPRAAANSVVVRPFCMTTGYNKVIWWNANEVYNWVLEPDCGQAKLWHLGGMPAEGPGGARYPSVLRTGVRVSAVSATLRGSNGASAGAAQGVRLAWGPGPDQMGPLAAKPGDSSDDRALPETVTATADGLPQMPDRALITTECVDPPEVEELAGACAESDPMLIDNLLVTLVDDLAPSLEIDRQFGDYISKSATLTVRASDAFPAASGPAVYGIGMHEFRFSSFAPPLAWRTWSDTSSTCPNLARDFVNCVAQYQSTQTIDLSDPVKWPDGPNTLFVDALDLAGNATRKEVHFTIDRVAPGQPSGIAVGGATAAGWSRDPDVELSWPNAGEFVSRSRPLPITVGYRIVPAAGSAGPAPQFAPGALDYDYENSRWKLPVALPARGLWRIELQATDLAGNKSIVGSVLAGFDDHRLGSPGSPAGGWFGPVRRDVSWDPPADAQLALSGICGYATSLDDQPLAAPEIRAQPDPTASVSLPQNLSDGDHTFSVAAMSCSGVLGESVSGLVRYDLRPPDLEVDAPGSGWLDEFGMLNVSATDEGAGVEAMSYAVDGQDQALETLGDSLDLRFAEGRHEVSVWARDAAGNSSPRRTLAIGFDRTPAVGWIGPLDPADQTRVTAIGLDAHSGVSSGVLQFRERAGGAWTDMPTETVRSAAGAATFSARFPDLVPMSGAFELRIAIEDRVGHRSYGTDRLDGSPAVLTAPLRSQPRLTAAALVPLARRCARAERTAGCRSFARRRQVTVRYGRSATVGGRLTDARGKPLHGARLLLRWFTELAPNRLVSFGTATTDSEGNYRATVPPGVNRTVVVQLPGSAATRPATASAQFMTISSVRLKVDRHRVRPGGRLVFTGSVQLGGVRLSRVGLQVQIGIAGSKASPDSVNTGEDGRFRLEYIVPEYGQSLRFRYVARVGRSAVWPFVAGESRPVTVDVITRKRTKRNS